MQPKDIAKIFAGVGAVALAFTAFDAKTKKEIGERDGWRCQFSGMSYGRDWNMQAAHFPHLHRKGKDNNPKNGRMLCTTAHIVEEILRGNQWGAKQLHASQTIRTYRWIHNHGYDLKLPFRDYEQLALLDNEDLRRLLQLVDQADRQYNGLLYRDFESIVYQSLGYLAKEA